MIHVTKIDETLLRVASEDAGVLAEIGEHFCFYADGYRWMPSYKNRTWDGRIRIFNARNNTLPFGLLMRLVKFANSRGYKITIDDNVKHCGEPTPPLEEIVKFIQSLYITDSKGNKIEPYDYQVNAAAVAISERRQLIISPTGSGKSLIIYIVLRWYLSRNESPAVIIVPTTTLVEQMQGDFADYSQHDSGFDPAVIQKIYSGQDKTDRGSRIVITTWQSAIKFPKSWFIQFGCLIGDEAHQFKAASLNTICNNLTFANYRIGTTGTLDGSVCNELVLNGNFGPTLKVTSTSALMESNTLANLNIKCIVLNYEDELRKVVSKMDYASEVDAIVSIEKRNRFIANLALGLSGNTLVIFKLVSKHGKPLAKIIKELNTNPNRPLFYVGGDISTSDRELIRKTTDAHTDTTTLSFGSDTVKLPNYKKVSLSSGEKVIARDLKVGDFIEGVEKPITGVNVCEGGVIITASLGTFSTGINIKNVHNIIFACPIKGQIKVLQTIGRGLRLAENGSRTTLYDICDNFSWKKKVNFAMKHGMVRCKIYDSEKFKYKIHEVNI